PRAPKRVGELAGSSRGPGDRARGASCGARAGLACRSPDTRRPARDGRPARASGRHGTSGSRRRDDAGIALARRVAIRGRSPGTSLESDPRTPLPPRTGGVEGFDELLLGLLAHQPAAADVERGEAFDPRGEHRLAVAVESGAQVGAAYGA